MTNYGALCTARTAIEGDGYPSAGAEAAAAGARFEITINLGDHVECYNKSVAIDVNDTDTNPDHVDTTDAIAAIAIKKSKDDDSGPGHI